MNTIQIAGESLITPKELAEAGIISLAQQSILRKKGLLKCYRNGVKIFYNFRLHIEPYLTSSGQNTNSESKNVAG